MSRYRKRLNHLIWLSMLVLIALPAAADQGRIRQVLEKAKRSAGSSEAQAEALARLAWPDEPGDPEVSAAARAELIEFGHHALLALRSAMVRVDKIYTADVTATLIHARRRKMAGIPPGYLPALEEAVWRGSPDAQRLAIPLLASYQFGPSLMACIDAAIEHPGLTGLVVRALAVFRDARARFYLTDILLNGPDEFRPLAANALAQTGGVAIIPLREGALADDPVVRLVAIRTLVPVSRIDDLTLMYEYVARFPDDDEELIEGVRKRTVFLESMLEQLLDDESASSDPFR